MQRWRYGAVTPLRALCCPAMPASANDLGCEVLICLSNPGGAAHYGACIPPMANLWQRLATGRSFPGCSGGGVASTKGYDRDSAARRRVVLTFADGRQQTYSLVDIEQLPASSTKLGTATQWS